MDIDEDIEPNTRPYIPKFRAYDISKKIRSFENKEEIKLIDSICELCGHPKFSSLPISRVSYRCNCPS